MDRSLKNTNIVTLKSIVLEVRTGMAALSQAKDDKQHAYLISLLRRDSITLAEQCWERHLWLDAEDARLSTQRDELFDDELTQQDDRWILAFRQYSAAMDLLGQVLEVLQADTTSASPGVTPHAQEALL